jgi:cytochrome c peroxidase
MLKLSAHTGLGILIGFGMVAVGCARDASIDASTSSSQALTGDEMLAPADNGAGRAQTSTPSGTIDTNNPYFQSLGINGRTCNSCHQAAEGWTVTPAGLEARFAATAGTDPIFRPHDGANWPGAPVATEAERRQSYSLLLSRGLIRIGLPGGATTPGGALRDYRLVSQDSPYPSTLPQLSLFRRPLPTTNLRFATSVNWDGRNTPNVNDMRPGLLNQSNGATAGHAQFAPNPPGIPLDTRNAIVDMELSFNTAQSKHSLAGNLSSHGATGGPEALLTQAFAIGATSPGHTFSLFDSWADPETNGQNAERASIADGQRVFNTKTFAGTRTCSGCHSAPNIGTSAGFAFFDVGVSAPSRRRADTTLLTFERLDAPGGNPTGELIETTDPGRALISGKWTDMNKFKAPILRGLAARAPYFHDGSANTIAAVVSHYESHFGIAFEGNEKQNLISFLESL